MAVNEETGIFGMDQGCAVHGDEHMRECSMCGAEFCRVCFPKTAVCPDCSEQEEEEEDTEENPDFDDVSNLGELIETRMPTSSPRKAKKSRRKISSTTRAAGASEFFLSFSYS